MDSKKSLVWFLGCTFSSILRARIVFLSGLLSVFTLILSNALWPILNETEIYFLLYPVDFLRYSCFMFFFVSISRTVLSRANIGSDQRGWNSIFIVISVIALCTMLVDFLKGEISDRLLFLGAGAAFGFVNLVFYSILILYSVTRTRFDVALYESLIFFLRNIHWFLLYFIFVAVVGGLARSSQG